MEFENGTELGGSISSLGGTSSGLPDVCYLCNGQFSCSGFLEVDEDDGFNAETVLQAFLTLPEAGNGGGVEGGSLPKRRMCFNCTTLFKNLMIEREILSRMIDDIKLLVRPNPRFVLTNSIEKIVSELFKVDVHSDLSATPTSITDDEFQKQMSSFQDSQALEQQLQSIIVTFIPEQNYGLTDLEKFSLVLVNQDSEVDGQQEAEFSSETINSKNHGTEQSFSTPQPNAQHAWSLSTEVEDRNPDTISKEFNQSSFEDIGQQMNNLAASEPRQPPVLNKIPKKRKSPSNKFRTPTLPCPICFKLFSVGKDLKLHTASHRPERNFMCEICGLQYRFKRALEMHLGLHRGKATHTCEYCNKSFTQKAGLKRHVTIHTGLKAYKCEICQKQFRNHTSFNLHKTSHKDKKEYECPKCQHGFLSKSHLKRHEKVHTGQKPYKCPICAKGFSEKYNQEAHLKRHNAVPVGPENQLGSRSTVDPQVEFFKT